MNEENIYIIVGGSGSGKTTLVENLLKTDLGLEKIITHTTRAPRVSEIDGQDYKFMTESEFQDLIVNDELIEYSNAYGNWYGTAKKDFKSSIKAKILILDAQGAINIKKHYPSAHLIYMPTDKAVLYQRLMQRGDTQDLAQRIALIDQELIKLDKIDKYIVKNNDFSEIFAEVYKYIKKSKKSVDII
jgi:guanylate kinase